MGIEQTILELVASGDYVLTAHAKSRMNQRGVDAVEIRNAAAFGEIYKENGKFKIVGPDAGGEPLTIVCVYEDGVLIITMF